MGNQVAEGGTEHSASPKQPWPTVRPYSEIIFEAERGSINIYYLEIPLQGRCASSPHP